MHCNVKSKSVFPFFFSVCYRQSDATTASWQPVRIQLPPCFEPVTNATGPRFVRCLGLFIAGVKCSLRFKLCINNVRFAGIYVPFPEENNDNPYCLSVFFSVQRAIEYQVLPKHNWKQGFLKIQWILISIKTVCCRCLIYVLENSPFCCLSWNWDL